MTTPAAAAFYLAKHRYELDGRRWAFYNPDNRPMEELPVIYGFNNGGSSGWLEAVAIAEDGAVLGGHVCSDEGYMEHDLGVLEGCREDRHEESYRNHYPDGYRMEFIGYDSVFDHEGLNAAIEKCKAQSDGNDAA